MAILNLSAEAASRVALLAIMGFICAPSKCWALATTYTAIAGPTSSADANPGGVNVWTESLTSGNGSQNGSFYGGSAGWGLYANSGQTASAKSIFSSISGAPLTTVAVAGDSVSIDLDHEFIDSGGTVGVQFFDGANSNTQVAELYYAGPTGGSTTYKINDSASGFDTSITQNLSPFTIQLTLNDASGGYSMKVGGTTFASRVLGTSAVSVGAIRVYNFNAGGASSNDVFFNNLTLAQASVPESSPAAAIPFAASITAAIGVYWRRIRRTLPV